MPKTAHVPGSEMKWNQTASRLLRAELVLRGISYSDLAAKISSLGLRTTPASIANKLARGTFSFTFFLICMHAIGAQQINIPRDLGGLKNGRSGD